MLTFPGFSKQQIQMKLFFALFFRAFIIFQLCEAFLGQEIEPERKYRVNCLSEKLNSVEFIRYIKGNVVSGSMNTVTLIGDDFMGKLDEDDVKLELFLSSEKTSMVNERNIEIEDKFHDKNALNFYLYPQQRAIRIKLTCKSTRDFNMVFSLQKIQYKSIEFDTGFLYISVAGFFSGTYRQYPNSVYIMVDNKNLTTEPYYFNLHQCMGTVKVYVAENSSTEFSGGSDQMALLQQTPNKSILTNYLKIYFNR